MLKVKQVIIKEHDLKKLCSKAGITLRELSNRLGRTEHQRIYKIAEGKKYTTLETWEAICSILDKAK